MHFGWHSRKIESLVVEGFVPPPLCTAGLALNDTMTRRRVTDGVVLFTSYCIILEDDDALRSIAVRIRRMYLPAFLSFSVSRPFAFPVYHPRLDFVEAA